MARTLTRSCLFGGALFACGVAGADALAAPEILYGPYAQGRVLTDPDGTGLDELKRTTTGPGPFAPGVFDSSGTFATFGAGLGEAWFTHDRPGATLSYSAALFDAYFGVSEPGVLEVEWDPGAWFSIVLMVDETAGTVVFDRSDDGAGAESVAVEPGRVYRVYLGTYGWAPGGASWGRMRLVGDGGGAGCNAADINGDGVLNFDDIDAFVAGFLGGCP